jgi:hypothetical protein
MWSVGRCVAKKPENGARVYRPIMTPSHSMDGYRFAASIAYIVAGTA